MPVTATIEPPRSRRGPRSTLESRPPADPGPHRWWVATTYQPEEADLKRLALLSPREREVVIGLASGRTNSEIAAGLAISTKTVDTHRGNALTKLLGRNNADLTRFAFRVGLVAP